MFSNPEITIPLLEKLITRITEVPECFNLDEWGSIMDPDYYENLNEDYNEGAVTEQRPACGAVGCIAGNICIITGKIVPKLHFDGADVYEMGITTLDDAMNALALDFNQARRLFYLVSWGTGGGYGWPDEFEKRLRKCVPGTKQYVNVTVDRIRHFIATGGEE